MDNIEPELRHQDIRVIQIGSGYPGIRTFIDKLLSLALKRSPICEQYKCKR